MSFAQATFQKARTIGKKQVYGKDTLTLGELIALLIAILIIWQGHRIGLGARTKLVCAFLVLLIAMLVW